VGARYSRILDCRSTRRRTERAAGAGGCSAGLCWVTCGDAYHEAFWQDLRKLGYADYKNITFDNRAAGGGGASLDTLALQLVGTKRSVIVADTTQSARALKNLTTTVPLVVIADDFAGSGFTSNLPRPDGNISGLSSVATELAAKQLQLLREAFPLHRDSGRHPDHRCSA
jgi:ABC-type uncharacterized transport system substrate-binding protein